MFRFLTFRSTLLLVALSCALIFSYALYLQHILGMIPCPMCIVQRYAMTLVAVFALLAALLGGGKKEFVLNSRPPFWSRFFVFLALLAAAFGAFVAARQSWLQWYPPEIMTCGRDFYGMIEQLPINRYVPLIFQGSGDCVAKEYVIAKLTVANLSFLAFGVFILLIVWALYQQKKDNSSWF
jgi:disulfide bond formation protein DsbB